VAGSGENAAASLRDALLWRYLSTPSGYILDSSFGNAGAKSGVARINNGNEDMAHAIVLDSNEQPLVAGQSVVDVRNDLFVWKFLTNGATAGELDASFGSGGYAQHDTPGFTTPTHDIGYAIALDRSQNVIVAGSCCKTTVNSIGPDALLVRFTPQGNIDTTFGNEDTVNIGQRLGFTRYSYYNVQYTASYAYSVAVDHANRIIMGGNIMLKYK
jgi:hypothetical protein